MIDYRYGFYDSGQEFNNINDVWIQGVYIISKLSNYFNVPIPMLEFQIDRKKKYLGAYWPRTKTICIYSEAGWTHTVLHEFAHHLHHEYGKGRDSSHGLVFAGLLYQVAEVWYGTERVEHLYPWKTESTIIVITYPQRRKEIIAKKKKLQKELEKLAWSLK